MTEHPFECHCAFCDAAHELATSFGPGDAMPKDGDITLCIKCGQWNIFDGPYLRQPNDAEYDYIAKDSNARRVRDAWLLVRARAI